MALTGWSDSNFLSRAAVVGTEPFFVIGWCNLANAATFRNLYGQGAVDTGANYRTVLFYNNNLGVVESYDGTNDGLAVGAAHPANTWHILGAAFTSGSSRSVWVNADARVDNTTAVTVGAGTETRIGKGVNDGIPFTTAGGIAEVSVWDSTGMSLANLDSLVVKIRAGGNPININAEAAQPWTAKLTTYVLDSANTLTDLSGNGNNFTMQGTLTNFASHPTIDAVTSSAINLMGQIIL